MNVMTTKIQKKSLSRHREISCQGDLILVIPLISSFEPVFNCSIFISSVILSVFECLPVCKGGPGSPWVNLSPDIMSLSTNVSDGTTLRCIGDSRPGFRSGRPPFGKLEQACKSCSDNRLLVVSSDNTTDLLSSFGLRLQVIFVKICKTDLSEGFISLYLSWWYTYNTKRLHNVARVAKISTIAAYTAEIRLNKSCHFKLTYVPEM